MNILIALRHNRVSGTASFNYTMASQFVREGHSVTIFFKNKENPSDLVQSKFKEAGCNCFELVEQLNAQYDVIFFNYNDLVKELAHIKGDKRFIVHGSMFQLYQPPKEVDKIFYLSENAYENCYPHGSTAEKVKIKNFIDTSRFISKAPVSQVLKTVLTIDLHNYNVKARELVQKTCDYLKLEHTHIGHEKIIWDIEEEIQKADLVIAYGRSVYEAMASERPVVIFGINGGDGYITPELFPKMLRGNCSGWAIKSLPKPEECFVHQLYDMLKQYNPDDGKINRHLVEELDVKNYTHLLVS